MYTFHSRVRYSETAEDGRLSLHSAVNYFQDCSTFQSEELGVGVKALQEAHHAWLMNSWQVVLANRPALGEEIAVSTWAYGFKGCYGYRNFLIQDQSGNDLAYANSIWVYVDTQTGRPSRCSEDVVAAYPMEPAYPMEHAPRKIAVPATLTLQPSFFVQPSDIDTNHHVNNCCYIRMAADVLLTYAAANQTVLPSFRQVRAEYRSPAVLGDAVFPSFARTLTSQDSESYTVVLAAENEKIYCIVEFGQPC